MIFLLVSLYIKNFALIDDITVEFGWGLNVLTGETGAGKSILLDALQVALGERALAEYIRAGEDKAVVQAAFQTESDDIAGRLVALGIEPGSDGMVVLSREISRGGRNWCRVNGQVVTLAMYRQAGAGLVDMHSQHQQQSLLDTQRQLELLDNYGGGQLLGQRDKVSEFYSLWQHSANKLQKLQNSARDMARQYDMLQYQAEEIKKANLVPGEDEEMCSERKILSNAERITALAQRVNQCLYSGGEKYRSSAVELIAEGVTALGELSGYDPALEHSLQSLESALYSVEDVARDVSRYLDGVEYDPQRLDFIERRLDEINRLKKKYGETVEEIISYYQEISNQLDNLSNSEEQLVELQSQVDEYRQAWRQQSEVLSTLRREAALQLETAVLEELSHLEMGKISFNVGFESLTKPDANGSDEVQFLIAPNPGEPLKPLHRIASGGELSRLMLAVKCVLAEIDQVPTLVFDEVDAGVGGRALHAVGEKMAEIGRRHQVITVTHAPQVACFAQNHYYIKKEVQNNRTYTRIISLDYEGRLNELARMLGGKEPSGVALEHAQELLKNC